jgi:hypothetical protein
MKNEERRISELSLSDLCAAIPSGMARSVEKVHLLSFMPVNNVVMLSTA